MALWQTIILAIVEGLTEFLPISSTGHMIIVSSLLGISQFEFTGVFITSIQFGAILSVVFLYWRRFIQSFDFYLKLFVGFLPFGIMGFLLKDVIDVLLKDVTVVAVSLVIGGFILLFIDKYFDRAPDTDQQPTFKQAFFIGLFQCFALIPGVSRAAATMVGGLTQGFNRKSSAEFSFLLAVPTMFVITAYQMLKSYETIKPEDLKMLAIGNVIAFFVAIAAIKFFVNFLTRYGFRAFGIYRIIVGVGILVLLAMGYDVNLV
ncbi:undecaprenyl-diphosphate phosphatase [Adhaeribacter soli]|uniref:Undecaprenyl-diphosphatase n=1 Tax=Adhaeribacter soli TaxID=2607655 RepID=A0A5N1J979_9BACT|nr:undecaprenyl-diphosphate phosphatase [Adhaeribacter soli]KAA9345865.1 undecaprenyl-diphosphate phosphatase [Adhaeribacter soli]